MLIRLIVVGCGLGVASRVEEMLAGFSAGISSDSAWVACAFAAGGAARGALLLTAANAGYYAWIALTQPALPLAAAAGPVHEWLLLGVAGGAVFGLCGRAWRTGGRARTLAAAPLAAVLAAEGADALHGGAPTDAIGLLIGLAFFALSAHDRRVACAGCAALLALAWSDAVTPHLP